MISISKKTLQDLEFDRVLTQVQNYTYNELAKKAIDEIEVFSSKDACMSALLKTEEYLFTFENQNKIPNHDFFDLAKSIHLLGIENTYIETKSLYELASNVNSLITLKKFFKKFKDIFPHLYLEIEKLAIHKEISAYILGKISKYADLLDTASLQLSEIRKEKAKVTTQISQSFNRALKKAKDNNHLDQIQESVIDGVRVLAVQAMHRKRVKGSLLGTSKTGSIVYIAPQSCLKYEQEKQHLEFEEQEEIIRILKEITDYLRPYKYDLESYQAYFISLEVTAAKAKYAQDIQACLPKIVDEKTIKLREAYHPLLWQNNRALEKETIPQDIFLHEQQQIIVISGPNAGGKSITLKTIGLLQVMLQSGLLIPVDEKSKMCFFDKVLTDIGDNQSIENQLSTYSYRLKNMRYFLQKCNKRSLFLIDEFGTGSDPELGGVLAEVFLEEFYRKKAFGVITTHYANLKALADELPNATNANMQFDKRSLKPLYTLVTGQAGSSFTFEVARQNGIPFSLINRAQKKVSRVKIRLDKTISKLQTERNKLQRKSASLEKEYSKTGELQHEWEEKSEKLQEKLEQFQFLYDSNQKMLQYGREVNQMLNRYLQTNNKKQLTQHFNKWVQAEKVKYSKKNTEKAASKKGKPQKTIKKEKEEQKKLQKQLINTEKEVLREVIKVREKKAVIDKKEVAKKANYQYKVGDIVRVADSFSQGTIDRIEGKKLIINYGQFTAETTKEKVVLVKAI